MGAVAIDLCPRCRREILPRIAQPSWHREKHRAKRAEREPSPEAQKVIRKNERKSHRSSLRQQVRVHGLIHTAKFFIETRALARPALSADCPDCLTRQRDHI